MQYLPMLLLLPAPYVYFFTFFNSFPYGRFLLLVYLAIVFGNMVYAFFLARSGCARQLLFWDMLLKLCHIPIYTLIFLIGLVGNIMMIPLMPFMFLFDALLLLSTSLYGIHGLRLGRREGIFSRKAFVLNVILHFLFCWDVGSAVFCYVKARKSAKLA